MLIPEETITNVNDKNSLFKGLIFLIERPYVVGFNLR